MRMFTVEELSKIVFCTNNVVEETPSVSYSSSFEVPLITPVIAFDEMMRYKLCHI